MTQKHFEIENYRILKGIDILVYIKRGGVAIPITIPKEQFEVFLLTEGKLILSLIYSDETGKLNSSCKLTVDEYFEMDDETVHHDLYQYILSHSITYRGQVYENPLVSINYAFNSHRVTMN